MAPVLSVLDELRHLTKGPRDQIDSADISNAPCSVWNCPQSQGTDAIASPFGKITLETPRKLRTRGSAPPESPNKASTSAATEAPAGSSCQEGAEPGEVLEASHRPLVIVIEGAEGIDPLVMQDLITVLSEVCAIITTIMMLIQQSPFGLLDTRLHSARHSAALS